MDHMDLDRETTDYRDGVEVAEGAEPVAAEQGAAPVLSLRQRMAAIRDECAGIGKQDIEMKNADRTKTWTIKGHTFEAVLSEIRPLFAKHGVDMTPDLVERTYAGNRCDVIVDFEFVRTDDSDESRIIRWGGAGTDNGDKAFAKAGTNAVKEMLKKRFLVTDRDDAKEETESVEHQTDEGVSRGKLALAKEERRAAVESWAKTFKAAIKGCVDLKDLQRLQRESAEQLSSEDLPAVTRQFFIEQIEGRKDQLLAEAAKSAIPQ